MEINLIIVLGILGIHTVADFFLQTDWMATNKSKEVFPLTAHVVVYSLVFGICMIFINPPISASFMAITFMAHWTTDFITSKITAKFWANQNRYWFFGVIAIDQFLHFTQLLLTYWYLTN